MVVPTGKEATLRKIYFALAPLFAIPSIFMYIVHPSGTVKYFGGTPSKSAAFWCSLTGGSDAVIVMLCLYALMNKGGEEFKRTVVQVMFVYSFFHFGGFYWHHTFGDPHPNGGSGYLLALLGAVVSFLRWGL